jgi:hypothetical protein
MATTCTRQEGRDGTAASNDVGPDDHALTIREPALDGELIPPETANLPQVPLSAAERDEIFDQIKKAHLDLEKGVRTTVEKAAALGQMLIKAKARFPHGEWLHQLETHAKIKRRMAARYVLLAKAREECHGKDWSRLTNLGIEGALRELQRWKEQEARDEALLAPALRIAAPLPTEAPAGPSRPEPAPQLDLVHVAAPAAPPVQTRPEPAPDVDPAPTAPAETPTKPEPEVSADAPPALAVANDVAEEPSDCAKVIAAVCQLADVTSRTYAEMVFKNCTPQQRAELDRSMERAARFMMVFNQLWMWASAGEGEPA